MWYVDTAIPRIIIQCLKIIKKVSFYSSEAIWKSPKKIRAFKNRGAETEGTLGLKNSNETFGVDFQTLCNLSASAHL